MHHKKFLKIPQTRKSKNCLPIFVIRIDTQNVTNIKRGRKSTRLLPCKGGSIVTDNAGSDYVMEKMFKLTLSIGLQRPVIKW